MTFDNERQKIIILELINGATVSGKSLDILYEFKQQVIKAKVEKKEVDGD